MESFHLVFFLLLLPANRARKFQLCELYYKLRLLGMDGFYGYEAKQLVCLSQFPAEANTRYYAVDHRDVPYYGIFQLSGHEWCDNGRHASKNKCKTSCDNVCIAMHASHMNTKFYDITGGIPYYGIFRLKGNESCNNMRHKSANKCNIHCDKFLDDDIKDDVACIKKLVKKKEDLDAWPHHEKYCDIFVRAYISSRCTFFFQRDKWYHTLTLFGIQNPLHIEVNK
ncbi:hypothetical protein JD844_010616 [Phrynosoma platyrhinos]|uniref:Glycosyl hydrolases family 22 (GH22) domain-containing protein n=1 Tax=Phrynosoma platyrhinos TaxID=52577 RepID=A0ABQ7TGT3_PHRPL|nr:hypothetical protein JD844_010616 [Phrynosoma platyrhinos]